MKSPSLRENRTTTFKPPTEEKIETGNTSTKEKPQRNVLRREWSHSDDSTYTECPKVQILRHKVG